MLENILYNFKITGISVVVPKKEIKIDSEINKYYEGNQKRLARIKSVVGLNTRRVVEDNQTASDLCKQAGEYLLDKMNIDRNTIDALIFVVQAPDYFQPATSFWLHKELNLSESCAVFDVNQGCAGYTYGLWLAGNIVQNGSCKRVLLLVGDTQSRNVNKKDKSVAPLFGDGGSATLIEYNKNANPSYFVMGADGNGYDAIITPAGGFRMPHSKKTSIEETDNDGNIRSQNNMYMDGIRVFNFTIKEVPISIKKLFLLSKLTSADIDYAILHQANKFIIESIAKKVQIPLSKTPYETLRKFGNQTSASIPITICDTLKEKVSNSKNRLILSGYGIGLSWCSCLIDLDNIFCSSVNEYRGK